MASCSKSRGHFQISVVFMFGLLCGHEVWNQIRPSVDVNFSTCRKVASSRNQNQIRLKTATTEARGDVLEKNNSRENYVLVNDDDSEDNFLFIGIMTARKFLDTRAFASSQTWVPRVPGKVVYFLGEGPDYTGIYNVFILPTQSS